MVKIVRQAGQKCTLNKPLYCPKNVEHLNILFNKLIFIFLCIGMIFTDLPISEKTVTKSLMIFIAPIIVAFIIINRKLNLKITKNTQIMYLYSIVTFIVSIYLLFFNVIIKGTDVNVYDTNIILKNIEAFISTLFIHFLVYLSLIFTLNNMNINKIRKVVIIIFIGLTIAAYIEYLKPQIFNYLHSTPITDGRLRLFTSEPSHAVLLYTIITMLSLYFVKKEYFNYVIIIIYFIILIFINSKGSFISLMIMSIIMFLKHIKKYRYILGLLIILLLSYYLLYKFALPSIYIDIEKYTSFSTRLSSLISSIIIFILYPFGLGYGTYLIYYPKIIAQGYEIANSLYIKLFGYPLSSAEISYIISTGKNVGNKSGITQSIMFNGWLAVIFWIKIFKNSFYYIKNLDIKAAKKMILESLLLFMLIQLLIGSEYTLLYVIWLPIAFIETMYYKQKRNKIEA